MPKIITGKCGHRCQHFYIRSRLGGTSTFEPSKYVYCAECDEIYEKKDIEYERNVRLFVKPEKGKERGPFVLGIPNKIRMKRPDRWGNYRLTEEEFSKVKAQIERIWELGLQEVAVHIIHGVGIMGTVVHWKLIPADIPLRKRKWGVPYDMEQDEYEGIEKKMKRKIA
jgi:hypothetical protein